MIQLQSSGKNILNKFETTRKIKDKLRQKVITEVENRLDLKSIIYKRVSINELFY